MAADSGEHTGDVGIDDGGIGLERECQHRTGGVIADARQAKQRLKGRRELPLLGYRCGRGVQVPSPPRVAESLPQSQHVTE
jgi:hypothetical protein